MSLTRAEVNVLAPLQVDVGSGTSADYVVAHAERQHQRGRNPSVTYKGISNPREALNQAHDDIAERLADPQRGWEGKAQFSGRIAMVHVIGEDLMPDATTFAQEMIDDNGAVGAIVRVPAKGTQLPYRLPRVVGDIWELKYNIPAGLRDKLRAA
jgi:hypothetical protein